MASSFNMGELLRNTTQLLAGNCDGLGDQNAVIDLPMNENNMSRESADNESWHSSLHADIGIKICASKLVLNYNSEDTFPMVIYPKLNTL